MYLYKSFKFELRPNLFQRQKMKQFCGSTRFIMNHALACYEHLKENNRYLRFDAQDAGKLLDTWEKSFPWLANCPRQILQEALKDLEQAFKNFHKCGFGYPKFKKKGIKESFRIKEDFSIDEVNNRIYLPVLNWIKYRNSRRISGTIKSITVLFKNQKFFISILTSTAHTLPEQKIGNAIGVDLGIARFATLSNGTVYTPLNIYKKYRKKFVALSKRLKNKQDFSKNRQKLKLKIAKIHSKIGNCRKDFLHKVSTDLTNKYSPIYVENLKIGKMVQSDKKMIKTNQKTLPNKKELNSAIMDQAWYEFRKMLQYKSSWKGNKTIVVSAVNTSRTCPACGNISIFNRKTRSFFECDNCGYKNHADVVGAINVLARGQALTHGLYLN